MAVSGNHHAESGRLRFQIEPRQVVQYVDRDPAEFNHFGLGEASRPGVFVDVAADGRDGRDARKFGKNFRCANVPGVNDVFRTAQGLERFGTKQSVSVGDDADQDGRFSVFSTQLSVIGLRRGNFATSPTCSPETNTGRANHLYAPLTARPETSPASRRPRNRPATWAVPGRWDHRCGRSSTSISASRR